MSSDTLAIASRRLIEGVKYQQQVRTDFTSYDEKGELADSLTLINERNAQMLIQFIDDYGWPVPSKFGRTLHEAAWLIAIDAISQPALLNHIFILLEKALDCGEPVADEYAKLCDRIALYEGRGQTYGTHFFPSPTGWQAYELNKPDFVDQRRAALGLNSFIENKEYVCKDANGFIDEATAQRLANEFMRSVKAMGWR